MWRVYFFNGIFLVFRNICLNGSGYREKKIESLYKDFWSTWFVHYGYKFNFAGPIGRWMCSPLWELIQSHPHDCYSPCYGHMSCLYMLIAQEMVRYTCVPLSLWFLNTQVPASYWCLFSNYLRGIAGMEMLETMTCASLHWLHKHRCKYSY